MGKKAKNSALKHKKKQPEVKTKIKKDKKKHQPSKKPLTEEEQAAAVGQFLAGAVKKPELISGMPIVLVCTPEIPENDLDDDEIEIEGDEEMGLEFLEKFMAPSIERSTLLWAQPIEDYLPEGTTEENLSQIVGFIQELRQQTGRNIVLTIEYSPEESFTSDRPIITTTCIRNQEFLNTLITPFGMFGFIELIVDPNFGGTYGRYYAPISVSILNRMGARACSTAPSGIMRLTVPWVAESKISFPPQRVDHYEPKTEAMNDAMRFWSMFYRGEIAGPDCPEAGLLQSMLLSDDTPSVRLYEGSSGLQTLDPDIFSGDKVQVLDDIELSDIELADKVPEKVLFGRDAVKWAQEQLDAALEDYYFNWHTHEYVIEFPDPSLVKQKAVNVRIT